MDCAPVPNLIEGPEWVYEIKLDGYRAFAIKSGNKVVFLLRERPKGKSPDCSGLFRLPFLPYQATSDRVLSDLTSSYPTYQLSHGDEFYADHTFGYCNVFSRLKMRIEDDIPFLISWSVRRPLDQGY